MDTEDEKKPSPLTRTLRICFGTMLICLGLIGATGKTVLGSFLTYVLAYLNGLFFPLVLLAVILLGILILFGKHPRKNVPLLSGLILLFVSALCFGSYAVYLSAPKAKLTSLLSLYADRFDGFAGKPFLIEDYGALGNLGGGFLGLFLVLLLGSLWGVVGDGIFFSVLLLFSLFLILYQPILFLVNDMRQRNGRKAPYRSPWEKRREMRRQKKIDRKLAKEGAEGKSESRLPAQGWFDSSSTREEHPLPPQANFSGVSLSRESSPLPPERTPAAPAEATPAPSSFSPVSPYSGFRDSTANPPAAEKPAPSPVLKEESHPSYPASPYSGFVDESDTTALSKSAHDFAQGARSPESGTLDFPDALSREPSNEQESQDQQSLSHMLSHEAPKPAQSPVSEAAPAQEKKANTFFMPEAKTEEEKPLPEPEEEKVPEKSPEEIQEEIDAQYFARKTQEKLSRLKEKQDEEQRKKASLMQYVSAQPRTYHYPLPREDLLDDIQDDKMSLNTEAGMEKAKVINEVFHEFNFAARVKSITIGASVTRFNVQTDPGVRADKLATLDQEIQIALKGDKSVRIETVVEGTDTSGIEIKNAAPMAVSFRSAFAQIENEPNPLLLPIGKNIDGRMITYPLDDMPHLLVAGTTGSGKSVLIHSMIMTLIMRNYPNQLKLMLIDPKQVEFAKYAMEPHLFCPVISDSESAINGLEMLCKEMDRRYTLLRNAGCVKISEYQKKRVGRESTMEELPLIVCVIDEFADLMQTAGDAVASSVQRITQKARAAGIYLIIATQRPSKDVIPMVIKANIPCRIGLSCSSQVDSRVILDENGAETLVGKGDLLFKCPGVKSMIRCQSPFISNDDMDRVLNYVKQNAGTPSYDPNFLDLEPKKDALEEDEDSPEQQYEDIKDYVQTTGTCRKNSLIRNFGLSASKANLYLLRLMEEGIITKRPNDEYAVLRRRY